MLRDGGVSCPVIFFPVDDGFQPAGISVPLTVISVLGVRRLAGKEKSVSVPGVRLPVFSRAFATAGAGMTVERNRERQERHRRRFVRGGHLFVFPIYPDRAGIFGRDLPDIRR